MINILIGLLIILGLLITIVGIVYLIGIIPNLWSNRIIRYDSIEDILNRGFNNLPIVIAIVVLLILSYIVGSQI